VQVTELKVVRYEKEQQVALITLNRPDRLNAWTGRMHTEYRWCLAAAEADADVRAVVVTGAGRGFCAGADSAALDGQARAGRYDPGTPDELARPGYGVRPEYDHPFAFHFGMRLPVIAAINGPAAGVGLVLACFCDIRFAAEGAKLTTSAGRLGLPAEYGLSWVLPRLVGAGHAADLLISSRLVEATEAATMGLVNRVLPPAELLPAALGYARDLATSISPESARAAKAQLYADLHGDVGFAVARSEALLEQMVQGPDFAEGVAALREKRPPRWPERGAR
jgi:enoyl-CoA hydratase/carnithine racemase